MARFGSQLADELFIGVENDQYELNLIALRDEIPTGR